MFFDKIRMKNGQNHYNETHSTLNEIMILQTRSGISESMTLQLFCVLYESGSFLWSQNL